jgi:hypothetical protein
MKVILLKVTSTQVAMPVIMVLQIGFHYQWTNQTFNKQNKMNISNKTVDYHRLADELCKNVSIMHGESSRVSYM